MLQPADECLKSKDSSNNIGKDKCVTLYCGNDSSDAAEMKLDTAVTAAALSTAE